MTTIDEIKAKIEQKIPLTLAERILKLIDDMKAFPWTQQAPNYKKEMIQYVLQTPEIFKLTDEDRQYLIRELNNEKMV